MDYEKKYKEALERAKKLKENPKAIFFEEENIPISDYIFPELAESEDERIRKELIDFVKSRLAGFPDCKRFTDWLEKQGGITKLSEEEQNSTWSEEDERLRHSCIAYIEDELEQIRNDKYGHSEIISDLKESCRERIKWLKSLKERYTWKPSEEQMDALNKACDEHWEPDGLDPLYTLYQDLKKLK